MATVLVKLLGDNKNLLGAVDGASNHIKGFAGSTAKVLGAGALAGGAAFGLSFQEGLTRLDLNKQIANELGISDADARDIAESASRVYADAWGDSIEEVADVITRLENGGLTSQGENIDDLTASAIAFAETMDIDVGQAIQTAGLMVKDGLAANGQEAFDLLVGGAREMPKEIRDELLAATDEYGEFFNSIGFNGGRMFDVLTKAAQEGGVFGIDKYGDAVKEFTIRSTDMSKASQDAYAAMGKDAELYASLMLEGGDAASDAFFGTLRGLESIEDPIEQAAAAIALFGTPLEDLNVSEIPAFIDSLQGAGDGIEMFEGAALSMADSIGDTPLSRLKGLQREFKEGAVNAIMKYAMPAFLEFETWFRGNLPQIRAIAKQVFEVVLNSGRNLYNGFKAYWPEIKAVTTTAIEGVVATAGWLRDKFNEYWPTIQATISSVFNWIRDDGVPIFLQVKEVMGTAVTAIVELVREHWPQVKEIISDTLESIEAIIRRVIAIAQGIWERWGTEIMEVTTRSWEAVEGIVSGALDVIQGIIRGIGSLMKGDWDQLWEDFKQILSGAWGIITSSFGGMFDNMRTVLTTAWDSMKTTTSNALSDMNNRVYGTFNRMVSWIAGKSGSFATAGRTAFSTMQYAIGQVFVSMRSTISSWFSDRITQIVGWGSLLYSGAYSAFLSIKTAITNALSSVGQWIIDNVLGPINSVWETIRSIGSFLPGIGNDIANLPNIPGVGGSGGYTPTSSAGSSSLIDPSAAARAQEKALLDSIRRQAVGRQTGGGNPAAVNGGVIINNYGGGQTASENMSTITALGGFR